MAGTAIVAHGHHSIRGFTLIEMLLVLALLGLITTTVITAAGALDRLRNEGQDAETTTMSTITTVRRTAVLEARQVTLTQDVARETLAWDGGQVTLPSGELHVVLLPPVTDSAVLVGGRLQETPIEHIRFFPDGTCDAFRIKVTNGQLNREIVIDPWTCAPIDPAAK